MPVVATDTLVAYHRYVAITGDTTSASADVEVALADAVRLLEEELRRPITEEERTERLPIHTVAGVATVYPSAVPLVDVGDYTQVGDGLQGATPLGGVAFGVPSGHAEVTYTGGWSDATLPAYIERDLAFAAKALLDATAVSTIPAGATSVRLGDAAVTFGTSVGGGSAGVTWSRQTLRHKRRFV